MNAPDAPGDLEQTLHELEFVLAAEHDALRRLDGPAIEEAAQKKLALEERLRSFSGRATLGPRARDTLVGIRKAAQVNHALIVHARACLKGTLDLLIGRPLEAPTYSRVPRPSLQSGRVNVRG